MHLKSDWIEYERREGRSEDLHVSVRVFQSTFVAEYNKNCTC